MRSNLNAVLSYGLVNVNVGICTAAQRKDLKFRELHVDCGNPVKQPKTCPVCDMTLDSEEIVSGFEFSKGEFILTDRDVLAQVKGEREKIIQLTKFVAADEVERLRIEKSMFLKPADVMVRAYTLLARAMQASDVVGVGHATLWGKESPIMVWPRDTGTLVLSHLFCYDEIADDAEIVDAMGLVPTDEQELADELIAFMVKPLDLQDDLMVEQRVRVNQYVESLIEKQPMEIREALTPPVPTGNLVEALRASIEAARKVA